MQPVLQARGDDADDAFVEAGVEDASAGGGVACGHRALSTQRLGLLAHAGLDVAPLAVDRVELAARVRRRAPASSVSRHSMPSVMSARRPAAFRRGPSAKPKSKALARSRVARRRREQRGDARLHAAGADALQALRDEAAVVRVEPTTSATVPSATRSSSASSRGCVAASNSPRSRSSARSASST